MKTCQKIFSILLLLIAFSTSLHAQLPATDIWLFDIDIISGRVNYRNPVRVTDRAGYDNQPSFTPDGRYLLFSSDRAGEQTDIFRYQLNNGKLVQLTSTAESEYSPQVIPGTGSFAVVKVEHDADSTQRIWKYNLKKNGGSRLLIPYEKGIGYFCFLSKESIATFIVNEPHHYLRMIDRSTRKSNLQARNIGRTLLPIPASYSLSYIQKNDDNDESWKIMKLNFANGKTEVLTETLEGVEDFCWASEDILIAGKDEKLYQFTVGADEKWQFTGDLGLGKFYRLAVSPDGTRLAVVTYREK